MAILMSVTRNRQSVLLVMTCIDVPRIAGGDGPSPPAFPFAEHNGL